MEALSGLPMDDVRVHYGSAEPARLQAHAFTRGTQIHLAPGQERHLPHETWHVVQQKQGRVRATAQLKGGLALNDDAGLEREADRMGEAALRGGASLGRPAGNARSATAHGDIVQGRLVLFNVHPATQNCDATWRIKGAQVSGDRPQFRADTMTALNARQPGRGGGQGLAIRHINAWGTMMVDLMELANDTKTVQQVGTHLHANWPQTSVIADPGIPNPLDDDTLANYAESWLDARHHDPKNLFWGNKAENSGLGEAYDNPARARGQPGGPQRSAFDATEKKALVTAQITAIGQGFVAGQIASTSQEFRLLQWLDNVTFPPLQEAEWRRLQRKGVAFNALVTLLSNARVFPLLELTKVFRTLQNKFGAI